jgi:hypothetical protein
MAEVGQGAPTGGGARGSLATESPLPFKPGERIAISALPLLRVENDVAILKKTRLVVEDKCGARHVARIVSPFMIRGGFRVNRTTRFKVPAWAFEVKFQTPYGTIVTESVPLRNMYLEKKRSDVELAEELTRKEFGDKVLRILGVKVNEPIKIVNVYVRQFKHAVVEIPEDDFFIHIRKDYEGDTYFVYEFISADEAKLVDDISRIDYVLHMFTHTLSSRSVCAKIRVLGGDVVWQDVRSTCCAIDSNAVAMVISRYKSKLAIAKNTAPYRGPEEWEVEEWESALPPRRVSQYRSTDPVSSTLTPEDVV